MAGLFRITLCCGLLLACSSAGDGASSESETADSMRVDFMAHCEARPEYVSLKRAGTLAAYCSCIYDNTMQDLSAAERVTAGFYLFGDGNADFHYELSDTSAETLTKVSQAIDLAVRVCESATR